ncbi:hypothetical protein DP56_6030 [Burkholderia pseudomallei]|nr:hypothetical protein DP56_6030 [Burkholderia pseudomallei]
MARGAAAGEGAIGAPERAPRFDRAARASGGRRRGRAATSNEKYYPGVIDDSFIPGYKYRIVPIHETM